MNTIIKEALDHTYKDKSMISTSASKWMWWSKSKTRPNSRIRTLDNKLSRLWILAKVVKFQDY